MFYQGDVVKYNGQDYVVLKINYKTKKLEIGIPNANNISEQRIWVSMRDLKLHN